MDTRQNKLESKKYGLIRASYWTGILGRLTNFFAIVSCIFIFISFWNLELYDVLISYVYKYETSKPTPDDMLIESIYQAIVGWWLLRIRDAFQAITEMIDELSETV